MSQDEQPTGTTEAAATDAEKAAEKAEPERTGWRKLWHDWIKPILTVVIVLYAFRTTVADWNDVPSGSMEPTIHPGDRIVVNKLAYDLTIPFTNYKIWRYDAPERGDIIVFKSPEDGTRLVKRVVGVPGDRISMDLKRLTINGEPLKYEWQDQVDYIQTRQGRQEFRKGTEYLPNRTHELMIYTTRSEDVHLYLEEFEVREGEFFVMGDNRDDSKDSRYYGTVKRDLIEGRAFAVALSFDYANRWKPRWSRWFSGLD